MYLYISFVRVQQEFCEFILQRKILKERKRKVNIYIYIYNDRLTNLVEGSTGNNKLSKSNKERCICVCTLKRNALYG